MTLPMASYFGVMPLPFLFPTPFSPPITLLPALSRARFCLSPPSPLSSRRYPTARISPVPPGRQCSHHPITDYPRLGEPTFACIGNAVGRVVITLVPAGTPCFCSRFVSDKVEKTCERSSSPALLYTSSINIFFERPFTGGRRILNIILTVDTARVNRA